jgi:UDP-N-acetylglucosamine--N-acetylmuramyl-(pentapeptide) pyrophosphoryl-undecaprenol N-acetylglucosamine transferase
LRLVVSGGGTGGHIYPAVAVAKEMLAMIPSATVLYVGTEHGMEKALSQREGLRFAPVRSSGVMGKSLKVAAKGLFQASVGVKDAVSILREFQPDVVLGTGGYASGPVVMASWLLRVPRAIQEQNAIPGKTNLALSRLVHKVFCAFEYSGQFFPNRAKIMVTGNPVRESLLVPTREQGKSHFGVPLGDRVILVLGGSRGARTLVETGMRAASMAGRGVSIILATGAEYYSKVVQEIGAPCDSGIEGSRPGNIIIRPYIHEMALAYAAADVVVARAGGMTLSEITALGKPSVIIPSPNVANNHQEHNARALEEVGAAVVVRESPNTPEEATRAALRVMSDESKRRSMSEAALRLGKPTATRDICRELVALARQGTSLGGRVR